MTAINLNAVAERYHRALNAKPGKGPISPDGIAAITDSVCDVPQLLAEIERLEAGREVEQTMLRNALPIVAASAAVRSEAHVEALRTVWEVHAGRGVNAVCDCVEEPCAVWLALEVADDALDGDDDE